MSVSAAAPAANANESSRASGWRARLHPSLQDSMQLARAEPRDENVSRILIGTPGGLRNAVARSTWEWAAVHAVVVLLARMPLGAEHEGHVGLALRSFFSAGGWLASATELSARLHELLHGQRRRDLLVRAWLALALRTASAGSLVGNGLPLGALQHAFSALQLDSSLSSETRALLVSQGRELADRMASEAEATAPRGLSALSESSAPLWQHAPLVPQPSELGGFAEDPEPNRVHGEYKSTAEYLGVHYRLLREDFIRPLREALEAVRRGEEPPREVSRLRRAMQSRF